MINYDISLTVFPPLYSLHPDYFEYKPSFRGGKFQQVHAFLLRQLHWYGV